MASNTFCVCCPTDYISSPLKPCPLKQHTILHFRFCNHVGELSTKPLPLPKHKLDHPLLNTAEKGGDVCGVGGNRTMLKTSLTRLQLLA